MIDIDRWKYWHSWAGQDSEIGIVSEDGEFKSVVSGDDFIASLNELQAAREEIEKLRGGLAEKNEIIEKQAKRVDDLFDDRKKFRAFVRLYREAKHAYQHEESPEELGLLKALMEADTALGEV